MNLRADDVYVWQRQWSAELSSAIAEQGPQFAAFRVLGAQHLKADEWARPAVDLVALRARKSPVVLVLRLPGAAPVLSAQALFEEIQRVRERWKQGGVEVARVEIDFDCAVSRLSSYREQLIKLRALLPKNLAVDITALPAWLKAEELPALLSVVDRVTLQVHSVLAPKRGLFDPRLAEFWVRQFSSLSGKPFSVALPAYGAKLLLDAEGNVVGVEHEADLATPHASEVELQASPQSVRALLDSLIARPVNHLESFVWFRLPLPSDTRAWAPATLKAVLQKQVLRAQIQADFFANSADGFDVRLVSLGTLPGSLPSRLAVNPKCSGEGVGEYLFERGIFSTKASIELKPGAARTIGWLRCPPGQQPKLTRP